MILVVFLPALWFVAGAGAAGGSPDVMALWLAAKAVAGGAPDLVYAPAGGPFSMLPPAEWGPMAEALGYQGPVYPYLYPPLWAWLLAPLTRIVGFGTFVAAAAWLNPLLIAAMLVAARRIAAPVPGREGRYLAAGLAVVLLSGVGMVALLQNQPQILVAFLTVLAVERAEHGAPRTAGALMGLAAALKVYPAILALVWLAEGRMKAVGWFALAGGVLGLASVTVAGWPMHREFLSVLRQIADSTVVNDVNYALGSGLMQVFWLDRLGSVAAIAAGVPSSAMVWQSGLLPQWVALSLRCALVAVALGGGFLLRRTPAAAGRGAIWPALMIGISLAGPLAWCYHFLAPAAFLPVLCTHLGLRRGAAVLALVVLATFPPFMPGFAGLSGRILLPALAGTLVMTALAILLLGLSRRSRADRTPQRALRLPSRRL